VLTTLSKIQELLVIARNSSFVFWGTGADIREIGRILGVRYVLEGSVRKAGNRVRLARTVCMWRHRMHHLVGAALPGGLSALAGSSRQNLSAACIAASVE
jgi:TolB-like protein